ncbi:MAG TPA: SRPBCC family protein [Terriglobales bacterium]|nr:SRPBCC family protein [Terriglobales bacterium]
MSRWFDGPMRVYTLQRQQWIGRPVEGVFSFFSRAENLQEITPRWLNFRILSVDPPAVRCGTLIRYALRWRVLPVRWTTEITRWDPPRSFVDEQISGPYKLWHHEHQFEPCDRGTMMRDTVRYELPFGVVGLLTHAVIVGRDVEGIFDYRERRIRDLFA